MSYVYVKSEPQLYTVGFYDPDGKWQAESDWSTAKEAAEKVHYLNGGIYNQSQLNGIEARLDNVDAQLEQIETRLDQPDWRERR